MKRIKNAHWYAFYLLILLLFVVLHCTPTIALRTNLFFDGYFKEALTSEIIAIERPNNEVTSLFYQVNPEPVEKATNGHLVTYKVEQTIWLTFASYYGEV